MNLKNDLILRAARGERTERTPVWLMRQAGRADPAYQALRDRCGLPLEVMFRRPDLAAEIALLPKRLGVDAIIPFQDILTPLAPMGAEFVFRPGPLLLQPVRTCGEINALRPFDPSDELGFVAESLRLIRSAVDGSLPIIGFAGAPLTLAFFLIEGQSPGRDPVHARAVMRDEPRTLHALLEVLSDMTADYLAFQIEHGADLVQLFESVADRLTREEYERFAHPYQVSVFSRLGRRAPTILFVKEQPFVELMARTGADVLSVGTCVDLGDARRRFGGRVGLQGNVGNRLLAAGTPGEIDAAVGACIRAGEHCGHILNLNHGLLPDTPLGNVRRFLDAARTTIDPAAVPETVSCQTPSATSS